MRGERSEPGSFCSLVSLDFDQKLIKIADLSTVRRLLPLFSLFSPLKFFFDDGVYIFESKEKAARSHMSHALKLPTI